MSFVSRLFVMVLAGVVGAAFLVTIVPAQAGTRPVRLAGCHEHHRKAPAPEPVSYECCAAGHRSAILQQAHASPSLVCVFMAVKFLDAGRTAPSNPPESLLLSSADPPGVIPLRI